MSGAILGPASEPLQKRIREEILPLFEHAVVDETAAFENPLLIACWEKQQCGKTDCPVFGQEPSRCWQVVGTYCGGEVQGQFADKYAKCVVCPVFTEACPTPVEELGEHLNNMLFLLRNKRQLLEAKQKAEHLNKELASALENLDARNREIQDIMTTDRLTGLYNRSSLFTTMDDELSRASRREYMFTLLMMDIDDFKSVNDSFGHTSGDEMLARFGSLISENIRKYDRAFRYGGEEFVIILPETELTVACLAAERIRKAFEQEVFSLTPSGADTPMDVSRTLSIGATVTRPDSTSEVLLMQADEAMYAAKTEGKNRVVKFTDLHDPQSPTQ